MDSRAFLVQWNVTDSRLSSDNTVTPGAPHLSGERRGGLLWAGFWLALVLVGAKAVMLGEPQAWDWPLELMRVSFRDVIFALVLCGGGELCALALARRPRAAALLRTGVLIMATAGAFFSVIACGIFRSMGRPLSFDLLRLIRGAAVRSSITDRLTWQVVLALVVVPVAFFVVARCRPRRGIFAPAILSGMAAWIVVGSLRKPDNESNLTGLRLALCPHVELVRSTVAGMLGRSHGELPQDFPPEDQDEFRPFGDRGASPRTGFEPPAGVARPRNVIVVVLESVGTKYLSLYGSRYATTPHLLAESRHAMLFDNVNAHAPYTFCTFMAVNFSIYPGVPWCYAPGVFCPDGDEPPHLPPTFAAVMKQRGWRTAYLHNGDMEWGGANEIIDNEGYEIVEDFRTLKAPALTSWGAEDRYLIDRLIRWIDEKPGQPFLAYCWTDQTHHPYAQSPGAPRTDFFQGKPPKALAEDLGNYLNVLHETDAHLGRLFAALRERGLADDTLVVITGDHGEAFCDPHDQRQHGYSVWQEEVNVPFMVWNPRLFPKGGRSAAVGGHVDLNPTIADILGAKIPDAWQGHSLFAPDRPDRTFFVASVDDYIFGIREDRWKYVLEMTGGREWLFDLAADPQEQRNILATDPARVKRMRQRLSAWISFEDHFLNTVPPDRGSGVTQAKTVLK